jgi:hypothetical protein
MVVTVAVQHAHLHHLVAVVAVEMVVELPVVTVSQQAVHPERVVQPIQYRVAAEVRLMRQADVSELAVQVVPILQAPVVVVAVVGTEEAPVVLTGLQAGVVVPHI